MPKSQANAETRCDESGWREQIGKVKCQENVPFQRCTGGTFPAPPVGKAGGNLSCLGSRGWNFSWPCGLSSGLCPPCQWGPAVSGLLPLLIPQLFESMCSYCWEPTTGDKQQHISCQVGLFFFFFSSLFLLLHSKMQTMEKWTGSSWQRAVLHCHLLQSQRCSSMEDGFIAENSEGFWRKGGMQWGQQALDHQFLLKIQSKCNIPHATGEIPLIYNHIQDTSAGSGHHSPQQGQRAGSSCHSWGTL